MRKDSDIEVLAGARLFLHVAQAGSFSAAARQVGLSPASVSRQMNALEEALGVRLMNRTSRSLSLTEAGQVYLRRMERILADLEDTRNLISQLHVNPRGTLRVHARISLGSQYIAPALPAFLQHYPDVRIDLWLSDGAVDLVGQDIDVAIRVGQMEDSSMIARKLASSPRLVCGTRDYFSRHDVPRCPGDLASHNCLTYRFDLGPATWRFMRDGKLQEVRVSGNMQTNNAESLRIAALSGLGLALLPAWSVHQDVREGRLRVVLRDYAATPMDFDDGIYAVYSEPRHLPAKTRAFVDYLVDIFRIGSEWTVEDRAAGAPA